MRPKVSKHGHRETPAQFAARKFCDRTCSNRRQHRNIIAYGQAVPAVIAIAADVPPADTPSVTTADDQSKRDSGHPDAFKFGETDENTAEHSFLVVATTFLRLHGDACEPLPSRLAQIAATLFHLDATKALRITNQAREQLARELLPGKFKHDHTFPR